MGVKNEAFFHSFSYVELALVQSSTFRLSCELPNNLTNITVENKEEGVAS